MGLRFINEKFQVFTSNDDGVYNMGECKRRQSNAKIIEKITKKILSKSLQTKKK